MGAAACGAACGVSLACETLDSFETVDVDLAAVGEGELLGIIPVAMAARDKKEIAVAANPVFGPFFAEGKPVAPAPVTPLVPGPVPPLPVPGPAPTPAPLVPWPVPLLPIPVPPLPLPEPLVPVPVPKLPFTVPGPFPPPS